MMQPATRQRLTVDGVGLACEELGSGELVLFVHGLLASAYTWRHVAGALGGAGWRCVSVDLMGFGASAMPPDGPYTPERQAELLGGLAVALKATRVHLVGHSYGAGVCLALIDRIARCGSPPLEVRSVVLADAACHPRELPGLVRMLRSPVAVRLALNLVPARALAKAVLRRCYHSREKITGETVREYAKALEQPASRLALAATLRRIVPEIPGGATRLLGRTKTPTLILWGAQDRIVPVALGRRLCAGIPGASLEVIGSCGHVPQEEHPAATSARIGAFLDAVG